MSQLPLITPEQRTEALQKAVAARKQRGELKDRLKSGSVTLAEVIEDAKTDDAIAKMKVMSLLKAVPGVGPVRAAQIMDRLGSATNRSGRGLGPNQRKALGEEFDPAIA